MALQIAQTACKPSKGAYCKDTGSGNTPSGSSAPLYLVPDKDQPGVCDQACAVGGQMHESNDRAQTLCPADLCT